MHSLCKLNVCTQHLALAPSRAISLRLDRLNVPDHLRVLVNATIAREETHTRHAGDGLGQPLVLLLVCLVNEALCVNVRLEVVRDEVVVAVVDDRVYEVGELAGIAENAFANGLEDVLEHGVQVEVLVEVCVAQVLDVFAEVAEEEDVLFSDFSCDLCYTCQ